MGRSDVLVEVRRLRFDLNEHGRENPHMPFNPAAGLDGLPGAKCNLYGLLAQGKIPFGPKVVTAR